MLSRRDRRLALVVLGLVLVLLAALGGLPGGGEERDESDGAGSPAAGASPVAEVDEETQPAPEVDVPAVEPDPGTDPGTHPGAADAVPRWQREPAIPRRGMVVAYYGTAGSGALGVLGENPPARAYRRLLRAAEPFERPRRPVRPVFELIVTIADAHPGKDGDYSHDIDRDAVRRYVEAARDLGIMLVLDIQTGRSDFLKVAKRWRWALEEPHVGLALDPEWRMGRNQVPGQVIGSVRAREVNRVSRWLSRIVVREDLPEKLFVLHQFRTSMLPDIGRIRPRDGLRLVQHVDGFGTPGQKRATYATVARPDLFAMGFKLFYDEDVRLMGAKAVHRIRPRVQFVSYQ